MGVVVTNSNKFGITSVERVHLDDAPFFADKPFLRIPLNENGEEISDSSIFRRLKALLSKNKVLAYLTSLDDKGRFKTLYRQISTEVLSDAGSDTIWDLISTDEIRRNLIDISKRVFKEINPNTEAADLDGCDEDFLSYLPLLVTSGCYALQTDGKSEYVNPNGRVSVGEVLSSIIRITDRDRTLTDELCDNRVFNRKLFEIYGNSDLSRYITRYEFAYILVNCVAKLNYIFKPVIKGSYIGRGVNWEDVKSYGHNFEDVCSVDLETRYTSDNVIEANLSAYIESDIGITMQEIIDEEIKVPVPLYASVIELDALKLFKFTGNTLKPEQEVSRWELGYTLMQLANALRRVD